MDANLEPVADGYGTEGNEGNGESAETRTEIAGNEQGLTREMIRVEVGRALRSPWQRILTDYIGTAPTLKALQKFADKSPDRWIQGAVMLAQLSGYSKEIHVTQDINVNVQHMSDADIQQRLNETRAKQATLGQKRTLPLPLHLPTDKSNAPMRNPIQPDEVQDVQYQDHPAVNPDNP